MTARLVGLKNQSFQRDSEGHRSYELTWHFRTDSYLDGPETVLQAVNTLFPVGGIYVLDNDLDPWAFCTPELTIAPHSGSTEGEPVADWTVVNTYTTKPMWRCNTATIDNPLLEPYAISGDFVHVSREMKVDRNGKELRHVNFEPVLGPEVEDKISHPQVSISFNSPTLPLAAFNLLINRVNDAPLWGFPKRCVRFTDVKWERALYGVCFYYYKIQYTFEMNIETFDKKIPAYGKKTLKKGAVPGLPQNYIAQKDDLGENEGVFLDKFGNKATLEEIIGNPFGPPGTTPEIYLTPSNTHIQTYELAKEGNLLLLGIPTTLP